MHSRVILNNSNYSFIKILNKKLKISVKKFLEKCNKKMHIREGILYNLQQNIAYFYKILI